MTRSIFKFALLPAATILFCGCISKAIEADESAQTLEVDEPQSSVSVAKPKRHLFQIIKHADANLDQSTLSVHDGLHSNSEQAVAPRSVSAFSENMKGSKKEDAEFITVRVEQSGRKQNPYANSFSTEALTILENAEGGVSLSGEIYQQLYGEASDSLDADGLVENALGSGAEKRRLPSEAFKKNALAKAIAMAALAAAKDPSAAAQEERRAPQADIQPEGSANADGADQAGSEPEIAQIGGSETDDIASIDQVGESSAVTCRCEEFESGLCVSVSDGSACVEQPASRAVAASDDPEELERLRRLSEVGGADASDDSQNARLASGLASQVPPESWTQREFSTVLNTLIGDAATNLGAEQEKALRDALNARADDLFPVFTGISYQQRVESFIINGFGVDVTYGCIALKRNDLRAMVRVPFSGASNQCELL